MRTFSSKCLIISRKSLISTIYRYILEPEIKVRVVGLVGLSKAVLKSSPHVEFIVLDFDLQDKQGTNSKIVKRVIESKNIRMLILTSHPIQRKAIEKLLSNFALDSRIQLKEGFSKYIQGSYFVYKTKKNLLASRSREGGIDSDQRRN